MASHQRMVTRTAAKSTEARDRQVRRYHVGPCSNTCAGSSTGIVLPERGQFTVLRRIVPSRAMRLLGPSLRNQIRFDFIGDEEQRRVTES